MLVEYIIIVQSVMAVSGSNSYSPKQHGGAFHVVGGQNVELSQEKTVALLGGTWTFKPPLYKTNSGVFPHIKTRRVVFSQNPINIGDTFQVYVTQRKHKVMKMWRTVFIYTFVPEDKGDKDCFHTNTQQNMVSIRFDTIKFKY